ncbi:MAG TPA: hypothetical protein PKA27_00765 [Fimbriimonadaceae bacterium]|nr:hypothetical protein [Fimbriimonadaceae bacterium]
MKTLGWLIAAFALGLGVYLLSKRPVTVVGQPLEMATLKPDGSPPPEAKITVGDKSFNVKVEVERSGSDLIYHLTSNGQEIEQERYQFLNEEFHLAQAAGETFHPPMKLLSQKVQVGSQWNWDGELRSGVLSTKAMASINLLRDSAFAPSGEEGLKVSVVLTLNERNDTTRDLAFWFVRGRGVVQRRFGPALRSPVAW